MTIQTTTLETSRLMKEAGFPQETRLYWGNTIHSDGTISIINLFERNQKDIPMMYPFRMVDEIYSFRQSEFNELYAAPTTDEILAELPDGIRINKLRSFYFVAVDKWSGSDTVLPEVLAKMWLDLKSQGLLKGGEL